MLFTLLVIGTVIWCLIGIGLVILPFLWSIVKDKQLLQSERLALYALFIAFEVSIAFACIKVWLDYSEQSGWILVLWYLLPWIPLVAFYVLANKADERMDKLAAEEEKSWQAEKQRTARGEQDKTQ